MTPQETVKIICEGFYIPGKSYPNPLPPEIEPWYVYCSDGGHCIVCVLAQDYKPDTDLSDFLVPVPVKTVLRSYKIGDGYVIVDVAYDPRIGLMAPPEDDEF